MARSPIVLIEFNELTPRLMDRWVEEGKLPTFKRFYKQAQVYRTHAEEEGEALNPWVQWVTVHTGLPLARHGIFALNDTHKLTFPQVWDLVSDAGQSVLVCGSMNAGYRPGLKGFVLPDPWSADVTPYPSKEFDAYHEFVRKNVQEYSRSAFPVTPADAARFALYMARHGISPKTVKSGVSQLWTERRTKRFKWKRAEILDYLQFDVFNWYWKKHRPQFSTFFLNSTAHYQHSYWRTMEPEKFEVKPSEAELADTKNAILYGYETMDGLLKKFMDLAGDDVTLVFATGLSQQPYLKAEAKGGKRGYRLRGAEVLAKIGVTGKYSYEPVMADQFFLRFDNEEDAKKAAEYLPTVLVEAEAAIRVDRQTGIELFVQCRLHRLVQNDAMLEIPGKAPMRYYDVFHLVEGMKSGYHHPDGMLWVRQPNRAHAVHGAPVSLRSIAPALLESLGVKVPEHMDCPSFLHQSNGKSTQAVASAE